MELSVENRKVLKELSKINTQMFFESDELKISSNSKNILAFWKWNQSLKNSFGIDNVTELISIIDLYGDPTITEEDTNLLISSETGTESTKYFYVQKEAIAVPPPSEDVLTKMIKEFVAEFELTSEDLKKIKNHSTTIKAANVKFEGKTVMAYDSSRSNAAKYSFNVDVHEDMPSIFLKADQIQKLITDDYSAKIGLIPNPKLNIDVPVLVLEGKTCEITYVLIPNIEQKR